MSSNTLLKRFADTFFYGNFFAGICAVSLCMETSIQHHLPLNSWLFYLIVFCGTVYYYTFIYIRSLPLTLVNNDRVRWYKSHQQFTHYAHLANTLVLFIAAIYFLYTYTHAFLQLSVWKYVLILLFPLVSFAYTFNVLPLPAKKLRGIGWLKPFVIGFVWSGFVSVYPIIFHELETNTTQIAAALPSVWLWLKNLMFISTLCIMFDIKDYDNDLRNKLNTYPVLFGINNTIRFLIVPLVVLGIFSFFMFTFSHHFPYIKILFNAIPYLLLIITAYQLKQQRSIIYYLSVIDGLMLVKAICGITGELLLN